jgi:phosphate transport system permease protein
VGGIAMSLAVIPLIYTISEDSLAAVPKVLTEGSLALGATKWETYIKVVLPAATPGIFAAILLGLGRAFGETMIVLMATGNAALMSMNFAEPVRTVSASIGAEMAEVVFGETHYHVLFLLGGFLFLFSFTLNAIAEVFIRDRLMRKFGGGQ